MELFYIVVLIILALLAVLDLIVGVSNDAVNFLNNAYGSRVSSRKVILTVASLGIFIGCFFAGGMMQVARTGIFHPEYFYFSEIIIICLAVMFTDVLLIDRFNFFALPTSTTVSLIFELLGASIGISLMKISKTAEPLSYLGNLINSDKALFIIAGIFISVVFAFSLGAIVQFITRMLFSFRTSKTIKNYGAVFGGVSLTAIIYFLIIESTHGELIRAKWFIYLSGNETPVFVFMIFIAFTFFIQCLGWFFRIDIMKLIILTGTFALAMSFAANDLVNFIGVPLTGYHAFQLYHHSGADAGSLTMEGLKNNLSVSYLFMFLSACVMIITLWFSRKADRVAQTTIDLSRQEQGYERFGSSLLSRIIVRKSFTILNFFRNKLPRSFLQFFYKRFEKSENELINNDSQAFDALRAAINLIVASILISIGTSFILPLSTTYVTFMVAMGTSMADGAWTRDTAVYRITGVFTVVGGWFVTAFVAFSISLLVALFIGWINTYAIVILSVIAVIILLRSYKVIGHKKEPGGEISSETDPQEVNTRADRMFDMVAQNTINSLIEVAKIFYLSVDGLVKQDMKQLKSAAEKAENYHNNIIQLKNQLYGIVKKINIDHIETGHHYLELLDYLKSLSHTMDDISQSVYQHVINNHKPLNQQQKNEISLINDQLGEFINYSIYIIKEKHFEEISELDMMRNDIAGQVEIIKRNQIKRIRKDQSSTRVSVIYFNILTEIKNILDNTFHVIEIQRHFSTDIRKNTNQDLYP